MKKVIIICTIAFALWGLAAKTSITQTGNNSYKIVWEIPAWELQSQGDYVYIQTSDLGNESIPGAPQIPYDECKVAIPESGSIQINLIGQSSKEVKLEKRLLPIPTIFTGGGIDENQFNIDERLYNSTSQEALIAMDSRRFRKLNFVPIKINPYIYDGKYKLTVTSRLEFIVTINGNVQQRNSFPLDELTSAMSNSLINPAQAANWQSGERAQINYADFSQSDHWVKIETDKDGMYKLTPGQLSMLPLADADPATFRMFTTGGEIQNPLVSSPGPEFKEIPIYLHETDGTFNASDYLLFYGRDRDGLEMNQYIDGTQYINPYSKSVCYWFTFGGSFAGSPLRINPVSAETSVDSIKTTSTETVRIENQTYRRTAVGFDWYGGKFFGNTTAEYQYTIDLEDVDNTKPQTLTIRMIQESLASSQTPHAVRLKVNGMQLMTSQNTTQQWQWTGLPSMDINHTGNYFTNGSNDILINVIRGGSDNLFMRFYQVAFQKKLIKRNKQFTVTIPSLLTNSKIRYDFSGNSSGVRVFKADVTLGEHNVVEVPVNIVNNGFNFIGKGVSTSKYYVAQDSDYLAPLSIQSITPNNLAQTTQAYDNVIITPPDFMEQAQSLVTIYAQKWNKRSKIVLLQDIFNQFNGGMPDPNAVRMFLKYCVYNYPAPAITTVTLLGAGTNDWRNFSGQSASKNKMIVYQKNTTTTDDYFATINTVQYPELAIGRYPVKTQNELNIMLSNLDKYINDPQPGIWRNSMIMLADDTNNGPTTGEYSHSAQLEWTSEMMNRSVLLDKIFAIDYEYDEFQNKPKARDDMFKGINDGKLVWYYIGHGSFDTLGSEDYFKGALDMGRFNNPGKLPLFIAASCDVAQFDSFSFDSAAEKVIMADNAGAIASIAATRECSGPSNVSLIQQYFKYSISLHNPVGYSLIKAKFAYSDYTNSERYNLLGDPHLLVTTPDRDSTLTIETASKDAVLNSRETVNLQGEFSAPNLNDSTMVYVFNNDLVKTMPVIVQPYSHANYTFRGNTIFKGAATVTNSTYNSRFVVPDDVTNGSSSFIVSYLWDSLQKKDYVNYTPSITLSDEAISVANPDAPAIQIFLNSEDYSDGDVVGTNPLLIAKISDQNGINVTNTPTHSMLLIVDKFVSTTNVTNYFAYDTDSSVSGKLIYPLTGLSEGPHMLQVIAFDNFNLPSVASTSFTISKESKLSIRDFMPYPNPMKKDGWFTFVLSEPADVKLAIYAIRGKKIKTISQSAVKGYNQLIWDGRDEDGDFLANNTYFIKLTAKSGDGKGKAEKTEKLIIYH